MRQTNLTAEQLVIAIDAPVRRYPRCFYVNELGELAQQGDATAEGALTMFLEPDEDECERAAAYMHLRLVTHPLSMFTQQALRAFVTHPDNADIIEWARREHNIAPLES